MSGRVVLFDIDGTLVSCDGTGREALCGAFEDCLGDADALCEIQFAGMTDRSIVRAGLLAGGHGRGGADDEATIDVVLANYLSRLSEILLRQPPRVLPGGAALVQALSDSKTALGLGTGNLAAGARCKLAPSGLWDAFAFGGFGSDREDRPALLEVGARRGAALVGVERSAADVVVIGDTPHDINGAAAIGARVVAVATPRFDVSTLREAGADLAVQSLQDPQIAAFVRAGARTGAAR